MKTRCRAAAVLNMHVELRIIYGGVVLRVRDLPLMEFKLELSRVMTKYHSLQELISTDP